MKYIRTDQYESVSKSHLNFFRKLAKTNKYAKGKEYCIIPKDGNYNIYEITNKI